MATAQNNFQHPSQYSSVILNSASSVSHAGGNPKNNNTFGLGQINIRNKIIKPPVPAQQPLVHADYNSVALPTTTHAHIDANEPNLQKATGNMQMINSKSTVSAVSQVGQDHHHQHEAGLFVDGDGDMDMDNVLLVEEQRESAECEDLEEEDGHEALDNDESIVYGGGESVYANNVGSLGVPLDGHVPQSHAFSLA